MIKFAKLNKKRVQLGFLMKIILRNCMICVILIFLLSACSEYSFDFPQEVSPQPNLEIVTEEEFMKGVAYTAWWNGEYSSLESNVTIEELIKPLGVNYVSVVVTCYQESITSTEIVCLPDTKTPTDNDLEYVIKYIHDQGMKVMLKPHIDIYNSDGDWRGQIGFGNDETAWQTWFTNYNEFINHYAKIAEANKVDYFVVGTELVNTSHRMEEWRDVILQVRKNYNGPVTYAANWGEVFNVLWWDDLDTIGVDAYYSLTDTNEPTIAQLVDAWKPITNQLGQLSNQWERPIIVTEIGYRSKDGANKMSYHNQSVDLQEQADCYQAFFKSFQGKDWWRGVFWWNWTVDPDQGGLEDDDFTANGKPAEEILRFYFSGK
jgi:hypothetical protein